MKDIILVGNPNVGKTTLFNTLTGAKEKASNWLGVTVDIKTKQYKYHGEKFNVFDIPGIYSLYPRSNEEKIACEFLNKHKEDLIVNICDANNLKRNLKLTKELAEKSYNVMLVVNMINEVKTLNLDEISKQTGLKIIGVDARTKKSVELLKNAIYELFSQKNTNNKAFFNNLSQKIDKIDNIINNINTNLTSSVSQKIDKILLNKFIFLPVFLSILLLIFYLTFGTFGDWFSSILNNIFEKIYVYLSNFINSLNMHRVIKDFLVLGILNSILSVISFLPQIILLTTFINILEDMGLMSRLAFMLDGVMKKVGLSGKSLFSIMMGYGCTSTAILTTRNLDNNVIRKRTALILPFSLCSAKLPVLLVISSLFFEKYKFLWIFLLYIFSVLLILGFSIIYKKLIPEKESFSIIEMPKYRLPYLKKILKDSTLVAIEFMLKVGTTIVFASAIFWLIKNFSFNFNYLAGENISKSILYQLSCKIEFLFKPIGLNQAGIIAVLFFGMIAKELVIVGLSQINGVVGSTIALKNSLILNSSLCHFTKTTSIIFLLFILLYSPCISALSTIKNEFNLKTSVYVFVFQFLLSYLICFIVYRSIININIIYILLIIIVLAIFTKIMIKLNRNKDCKGNCNACRKI